MKKFMFWKLIQEQAAQSRLLLNLQGIPIAKIAAKIMIGEDLKKTLKKYKIKELTNFNVKESVFPFNKFDGVDLIWVLK